ncbi:hypothetical protein CVT25_008388, partial [Psilocybe cyanescens]
LRRVCPQFSLDAFARALCHIHYQPRHPHLADQLSSAYDAFLEINRTLHWRTQDALKRGHNWEQLNVCVPCLYKTKDEPPLKFSFLAAMDANNSLKLVDRKVRHDNRTTDSLRWITPEDIDVFKDEVHREVRYFPNISTLLTFQHQNPSSTPETTASHPPAQNPSTSQKVCFILNVSTLLTIQHQDTASTTDTAPLPSFPQNTSSSHSAATQITCDGEAVADGLPDIDDDVAWLNINEMDDLSKCINTCVERWRNTGPEARKKMYALFAIAGIFLAVCQHGHVLVLCDMIRSGELCVISSHLLQFHSFSIQHEIPVGDC